VFMWQAYVWPCEDLDISGSSFPRPLAILVPPNDYSGLWRVWSRKGILRSEMNYSPGRVLDGMSKEYGVNGLLQYVGNYTADNRNGWFRTFQENGILIKVAHYRHGQNILVVRNDESGKLSEMFLFDKSHIKFPNFLYSSSEGVDVRHKFKSEISSYEKQLKHWKKESQ